MSTVERSLSRGHKVAVGTAMVPMVAAGAFGAWGTYTNMRAAFPGPTALGVVAAGEGATLVLAVLLAVLTMFGQPYPAAARAGLWALPALASFTGVVVAGTGSESVVYAMTPLAMSVSAEGLGFLIRRVVVYRTGIDAEAQRRNAETMQKLAYHRARAANHPKKSVRKSSELKSWRLARTVGHGDTELGAHLVTVQRDRMSQGADTALSGMFTLPPAVPALEAPAVPEAEGVTPGLESVTPPVTPEDTQVTPDAGSASSEPVTPVTPDGEAAVTPDEQDTVQLPAAGAVTLDEVAAVAGVETPAAGVTLTDTQLVVVLRHLRYSVDPPMSYRQAATAFRDAGYVGGEKRVRAAWGVLLSHEENAP